MAERQGPRARARRAVGQLPHPHGDGGDGAAARHVPADSRRLRRAGREGGSRRAGGAAADAGRSVERPSGVRPLARPAGPPAHRPRGREPLLADVLRDRPGQDVGELRVAGGVPQPSRAAGLAGDDVHRFRLGRQGVAAGHRDQLDLPPGVESDAGGDRGGSGEPPPGAWTAPAHDGADGPRPGAVDRRSARPRLGGPSVRPYQPEGLWEEQSSQEYKQSTGDDLYRRSLYTYWKRTLAPPSMLRSIHRRARPASSASAGRIRRCRP